MRGKPSVDTLGDQRHVYTAFPLVLQLRFSFFFNSHMATVHLSDTDCKVLELLLNCSSKVRSQAQFTYCLCARVLSVCYV